MWSEVVLWKVKAGGPSDIAFLWWVLEVEYICHSIWFSGMPFLPISDSLPVSEKILDMWLLIVTSSEEELENLIVANISTCFLGQKIFFNSMTLAFGEE